MTSLGELALLFLRLGATAFGGPAAHVAMMRDEVVTRRGWLSDEEFLDLVGATNLIPGPNSTELAIHLGWRRRRWAGLVVAGVCFIVPAMLITAAMGWAYVEHGHLPAVEGVLYGVKPVVLAVVLQAIAGLLPTATRTRPLALLAAAAVLLTLLGVHELVVLFGAGAVAIAQRRPAGALIVPVAFVPAAPVPLPSLFFVFFKTGCVLYGSGYVLLAFLRADLVERLGWLTEAQLVDAIAVGQVTPGPVFTTATFVGWILGGPWGALVATAGIFLPAFVFVALSGPLVPKLRASPTAGAFLDGVNAASFALMVTVTIQLGSAAVVDVPTAALLVLSAGLLLRYRINATWLVVGGALIGLLMAR